MLGTNTISYIFLIEMTFVNSHTQKNMLGMFSVETHT